MRKVMIVDDESLVRIGLQSMIQWEVNGYKIAGVFKNGEEALEAAKHHSFDIVLTDIKMPGMDGLELIRELRKLNSEMKFIILSSYNDFEYMRQAIKLEVKDYISKYELEPEDLFNVLNNLTFSETAEVEKASLTNEILEIDQWEKEKQFILDYSINEHLVIEECLLPIWDAHCNSLEGSRIRWITINPIARATDYSQSEWKAMEFAANELFSRLKNPFFLGESQNILHGIRIETNDESELRAQEHLERMATEWISAFSNNLNISIRVGISSSVEGIKQWQMARDEAKKALMMEFFTDKNLFFYSLDMSGNNFSDEEWFALHRKIRTRVQFLQFDLMAAECIEWFEELSYKKSPKEWVRLFSLAASQLANELIESFHLERDDIREYFGPLWPFSEVISQSQTKEQLISLIRKMSEQSMLLIQKRHDRVNWVNQVKKYVKDNYSSNIRLEEVAELVSFSVNHFSGRFRQETGEAFTDYLTRIRIKEATRLIRESNLSTEEIAERVGYPNANYFVKVFKKKTGQTIKEFKKKVDS